MGQPAAKKGDKVHALDTHIVKLPNGAFTPLPHPFVGTLDGGLSRNVTILGQPAATEESTARIDSPHVPTPPGVAFQKGPANQATIFAGSKTVRINGKPAARNGDLATTCNDPVDLPKGTVQAKGSVTIG
jgi:uncharacterized Zn-binding protein involved in type VI secretion